MPVPDFRKKTLLAYSATPATPDSGYGHEGKHRTNGQIEFAADHRQGDANRDQAHVREQAENTTNTLR